MNWTGGKLQRHSKANANPIARAQKQHFAKARLRRETGHAKQLSSGTISLNDDRFSLSDHFKARESQERLGQRPQPHPHQSPTRDPSLKSKQAPSGSRISKQPSPTIEPVVAEDIKTKLLRNPDWLNLSATSPAQIRFPSARDSANVAKRRKITHEDLVRQQEGQKRQISPASLRHRRNDLLSNQSQKISIRIGPDIHRSQPTISQAVNTKGASSSQAASSDSMLLDELSPDHRNRDFQLHQTLDIDTNLARLQGDSQTSSANVNVELPTLDKFLDSENFDQVKERSASHSTGIHERSRSTYPSSPPLQTGLQGGFGVQDRDDNHLRLNVERVRNHQFRNQRSSTPIEMIKRWSSSSRSHHPRYVFTLDKQVEQESSSTEHTGTTFNRLHDGQTTLQTPSVSKFHPRQSNRVTESLDIESNQHLSHRTPLYPTASLPLQQPVPSTVKRPFAKVDETGSNTRDDNEAWMKFILGDELDGINAVFRFDSQKHTPAGNAKRRRIDRQDRTHQSSSLDTLAWTTGRGPHTPKTVQTSANTVLHTVQELDQPHHSETDFLSQLSPMEGFIDDRLGNISVYNNPARTIRSFVAAPRKGCDIWDRRDHQLTTASTESFQKHLGTAVNDHYVSNRRHVPLSTASPHSSSPLRDRSPYNSTPAVQHSSGETSRYFQRQSDGTSNITSITPLQSAFSDGSSITEPIQSSTHRQPLQDIHTGNTNMFVFKKPPIFPKAKTSSVLGTLTPRRGGRFIMPYGYSKS